MKLQKVILFLDFPPFFGLLDIQLSVRGGPQQQQSRMSPTKKKPSNMSNSLHELWIKKEHTSTNWNMYICIYTHKYRYTVQINKCKYIFSSQVYTRKCKLNILLDLSNSVTTFLRGSRSPPPERMLTARRSGLAIPAPWHVVIHNSIQFQGGKQRWSDEIQKDSLMW